MRTLGVVGSLFSLMHTLVLFGSPFVMMADVWFWKREMRLHSSGLLTTSIAPPALVAVAAAVFNVQFKKFTTESSSKALPLFYILLRVNIDVIIYEKMENI